MLGDLTVTYMDVSKILGPKRLLQPPHAPAKTEQYLQLKRCPWTNTTPIWTHDRSNDGEFYTRHGLHAHDISLDVT